MNCCGWRTISIAGPTGRASPCRPAIVAVGAGPYPAESVVGKAAARFVEQFPRVSMQIRVNTWGSLLQQLRNRELDFIVLETSQLQRERDIEAPSFTYSQTVYFVARSRAPTGLAPSVSGVSEFSAGRSSRRRGSPRRSSSNCWPPSTQPSDATFVFGHVFPAIECSDITTVKRIVENSNAITAVSLTSVADELESGRFVVLCTAPWLQLNFGVVSLKGRPLTHAAGEIPRDRHWTSSAKQPGTRSSWSPGGRRRRPVRCSHRPDAAWAYLFRMISSA